jgi:thiosulfate dehydrogenase [quinone] large subunit
MRNMEVKEITPSRSIKWRKFGRWGYQSLFVIMRILFGMGWFLAGVTKIIEKGWFSEPGVFLTDYLITAIGKSHVPEFYSYFIKNVLLDYVTFLNYAIPLVQITIGLFLVTGLVTFPSILIALFMHINFILSGNINFISLVLYTTAFGMLLSGTRVYVLSLDRYLRLEHVFIFHRGKSKEIDANPMNETGSFNNQNHEKKLAVR